MRSFICGLAVIGLTHSAFAADYSDPPYLRGSDVYEPGVPSFFPWSGAYIGGQIGYSSAHMDFRDATSGLVAFILRESALENVGHVSQWQILGTADAAAASYGGFIGYNSQWEDIVLGVEFNYNRTSLYAARSGSLGRIVSPGDGFAYDTTVTSSASTRITDFGTFRTRVGYVMGRFLPYGWLGVAVGRAENFRSATVFAAYTDTTGTFPPGTYGPFTQTESRPSIAYGYAAGLGVDVAITPNLFWRAEYEFVQFAAHQKVMINTARTALALKF